MSAQPYKAKANLELKKRAVELYRTGLTLMEVCKIIERSHQWVKLAVDELDKVPSKIE